MARKSALALVVVLLLGTTGCIGTIVGTTADVAVEIIKFPFKVVKGVGGVLIPDGDNDHDDGDSDSGSED